MFCSNCGAELREGSRFCPSCGAPVRSADPSGEAAPSATQPISAAAVAPSEPPAGPDDGAAQGTRPSPGPSRDARTRVIIVASVVVALLAVVAILFVTGTLRPQTAADAPATTEAAAPTVVTYGSSDGVDVAPTGTVVPADAQGQPLTTYTVRVIVILDLSGNPVDASAVQPLTVSGPGGFTPEQLCNGLADLSGVGTCRAVVTTDDGYERQLPDIRPTDDGADSVTVTPPAADDGAADTGYAAAYLSKIQEYQATYGVGQVASMTGIYDPYNFYYARGVFYVALVDFGDGTQRLVISYCAAQDPEAMLRNIYENDGYDVSDEVDDVYKTEVWNYDAGVGGMTCEWSGPTSVGNYVQIRSSSSDGTKYLLPDLGEGFDTTYQPVVVGLQDSGTVGVVDVPDILLSSKYDWNYRSNVVGITVPPRTSESELLTESISTVDTVMVQLQQLVAQAAAASAATTAATPAAQDQPVTAKEVTEALAVPMFDGAGAPDGTESYTWGYLELSGGDPSVTAKINETLKREYDERKQATLTWAVNPDGTADSTQTLKYRSSMTYCANGLVAVRAQTYGWFPGASGYTGVVSHVFDLATGEEVSPARAAGMTEDDLQTAAIQALSTFKASDTSRDRMQNDPRDMASNGTYLVVPEGVTIRLTPDEQGVSWGVDREIVVKAFDDDGLVGTNVADEYNLPISPNAQPE